MVVLVPRPLLMHGSHLTTPAVELRMCGCLRELNLEGNRIATPVLDLRPMKTSLQSLQVGALWVYWPGGRGDGGWWLGDTVSWALG